MSLQKTIMAPAFTCLNHPLSLESLPLPQKPWVLHTEFNRETGTRPTLTHTIYLTFHLNVGFSTNTRLNTFFKSELHRKQEAAPTEQENIDRTVLSQRTSEMSIFKLLQIVPQSHC